MNKYFDEELEFFDTDENGYTYYSMEDGQIKTVSNSSEHATEMNLPYKTKKRVTMFNGKLCFEDEIPKRKYKVEDYDYVMEEILKEQKEARGYTTREPSDYINSKNERWHQDAVDWIDYRDRVMEYALNVQNQVGATPYAAPTIDEFIERMPKITWTYP